MMIDYIYRRLKRLWQKTFPQPERKPIGGTLCREIKPADLEAVIALLTKGFWQAPHGHFEAIMRLLSEHRTPEGFPKYGYMLENDHRPVGILLQIFTERFVAGERQIWCCGSSFYVEPHFRAYSDFLFKKAHHFKGVTYLDLASTPKRWETMKKQGYRQIAKGVYAAIPALCRPIKGGRLSIIRDVCVDGRLDPFEVNLLVDHARFKNDIAIVCEHAGVVYPFVFAVRHRYGVPFAFLLYCRRQPDFVMFAGTLGRYLAKRGLPLVLFDADGPVERIPGRFMSRFPKFWKGSAPPPLGDLAYTEIAMFGVF